MWAGEWGRASSESDLGCCVIILRDKHRFRVLKSIIQSNKTSSISSYRTFRPPPFNCFLLVDSPLVFSSSNFLFCLHYSLIRFESTSNSIAAASLPVLMANSTALNFKATSKDLWHSLLAMLALSEFSTGGSRRTRGDLLYHTQVYSAFNWTPGVYFSNLCLDPAFI